MNRPSLDLTLMLGAGFSTLATTLTQLSVYDGSGGGFVALVPVALGGLIALDHIRGSPSSTGTDDRLKEGADA